MFPRYHHEPSGEAHHLWFEQFSHVLGTREFVVYNPRGEQQMTSHDRICCATRERILALIVATTRCATRWKRILFDWGAARKLSERAASHQALRSRAAAVEPAIHRRK